MCLLNISLGTISMPDSMIQSKYKIKYFNKLIQLVVNFNKLFANQVDNHLCFFYMGSLEKVYVARGKLLECPQFKWLFYKIWDLINKHKIFKTYPPREQF